MRLPAIDASNVLPVPSHYLIKKGGQWLKSSPSTTISLDLLDAMVEAGARHCIVDDNYNHIYAFKWGQLEGTPMWNYIDGWVIKIPEETNKV